jgi:hypothetical protein
MHLTLQGRLSGIYMLKRAQLEVMASFVKCLKTS